MSHAPSPPPDPFLSGVGHESSPVSGLTSGGYFTGSTEVASSWIEAMLLQYGAARTSEMKTAMFYRDNPMSPRGSVLPPSKHYSSYFLSTPWALSKGRTPASWAWKKLGKGRWELTDEGRQDAWIQLVKLIRLS